MKRKFLLICVVAIATSSYAADEKSLIDAHNEVRHMVVMKHDPAIKKLQEQIENHEHAINNLNKQVDRLGKKVNELVESVSKISGRSIEPVPAPEPRRYGIAIYLVLIAIAGILFFFIRKILRRTPQVICSTDESKCSNDASKCPRCGWERDPTDTVCKNPKCKLQF